MKSYQIESLPLGEIALDKSRTYRGPAGMWCLGIPTSGGRNIRCYMTEAEALQQKQDLVVTDPAIKGFKLATGVVTLNVGDLFQVAGSDAEQHIVDLRENNPKVKASEAITAIPASVCITEAYEVKPTIKAHLRFGDKVKIGRSTFVLSRGGNSHWVELVREAR